MSVADTIRDKLTRAFSPTALKVIDESHLHAGHSGARPEGETHFRVQIISEAFVGMNRVERQRAVNKALSDELAGPVHALGIDARPPEEG